MLDVYYVGDDLKYEICCLQYLHQIKTNFIFRFLFFAPYVLNTIIHVNSMDQIF